jgi:hypothetical protein
MSNIQSPVVKLKDAARTSTLAANLHNQTHSKRTTDLSFPKNKRGELPEHNIDQTLVEGKESRQDLKGGRQRPSPTRHFGMERIPERVPMEVFQHRKSSTDMIIDTFRHKGKTKGVQHQDSTKKQKGALPPLQNDDRSVHRQDSRCQEGELPLWK